MLFNFEKIAARRCKLGTGSASLVGTTTFFLTSIIAHLGGVLKAIFGQPETRTKSYRRHNRRRRNYRRRSPTRVETPVEETLINTGYLGHPNIDFTQDFGSENSWSEQLTQSTTLDEEVDLHTASSA